MVVAGTIIIQNIGGKLQLKVYCLRMDVMEIISSLVSCLTRFSWEYEPL